MRTRLLQKLICGIGIPIDARKLAESGAHLSLQRVTPDTAPDLRGLLLPWYLRDGLPVVHDLARLDRQRFPNVHPRLPEHGDMVLSIGDAADTDYRHPWYKPDSVRPDPDPHDCFPAYRVGDRLLLLDGNHRCISLVRYNVDYAIDLLVISGPINPEIMPDLAVFGEP
jgi:hypothetical protein